MVYFFVFSLLCIFWAYFGYPLSLLVLRLFNRRSVLKKSHSVPVTFIITAYNEEKRIREKIENTLQLDYPTELLELFVASDGSSDNTNGIVLEYADKGVTLLNIEPRGGKENAQKYAVLKASGDILVFSDVATKIDVHALQEIVANFADPSVGCVSSEDKLIGKDGKPSGEGVYVRYEMWLRRLETSVNSVVGLSGSFFAARKEVCRDFSGDVQSDFRTLLSSITLGMRGVSDHDVIGYYSDIVDEKREFERKVRTVLRGLTVFFQHYHFLNLYRYGFFSYQLFCHKLLRWLVPVFLLSVGISNAFLATSSSFFFVVFIGQILFYCLAAFGLITNSLSGMGKIPTFFVVVNSAITIAWFKYLTGTRIVLWTPSER